MFASPAFQFFLERHYSGADLDDPDLVENYSALDDSDILFSLKQWRHSPDPILSDLCRRFLDRDFFRVSFLTNQASQLEQKNWADRVQQHLLQSGLSHSETVESDAQYYLAFGASGHAAYERSDNSIGVVQKDGSVVELSEATNLSVVSGIARPEQRAYVCYPKEIS